MFNFINYIIHFNLFYFFIRFYATKVHDVEKNIK